MKRPTFSGRTSSDTGPAEVDVDLIEVRATGALADRVKDGARQVGELAIKLGAPDAAALAPTMLLMPYVALVRGMGMSEDTAIAHLRMQWAAMAEGGAS